VLLAELPVGVFDLLMLLDVLFAHVSELACHVTMQRDADTHDATISLGFCVLTHCSINLLHVAQGVSPSQRIFLLRHRSQALETDFLRGCQSRIVVGEKRLGPSEVGNDAGPFSMVHGGRSGEDEEEVAYSKGTWLRLAVEDSAPESVGSENWTTV
jgi:hypothetical protein